MPADIATYVIAHREGIPIARYLDVETVERVNEFDRRLEEKEGRPVSPSVRSPGQSRQTSTSVREIRFERFRVPPETLPQAQVRDAEKMAGRAYPLLYVFENSARAFIDGHLWDAYGDDWFQDSAIVSRKIRDVTTINREAEKRSRYHSQRGARPIYYTNLDHLAKFVQSEKGDKIFIGQQLFPRPTWFPELVGRFEDSRNVVAHMNPLPKRDIDRLEHGLEDWLAQIADHLPPTF